MMEERDEVSRRLIGLLPIQQILVVSGIAVVESGLSATILLLIVRG